MNFIYMDLLVFDTETHFKRGLSYVVKVMNKLSEGVAMMMAYI